jgi:hypothetical protein
MDALKLKSMAIATWRTGGMNTLVKVMPMAHRPDPRLMVGACTSFKYIAGRTPEEMGQVVGVRTKLASGASVYLIRPLPIPDEFDLRGYTQTPGGVATDHEDYRPHPEYPPGHGAPEWHLARVSQNRLVHLANVPPGVSFKFMVATLQKPV